MRPAPAFIAVAAAWGLAGLAIPLAGLPLPYWRWAGALLALAALLDALVLLRHAPQLLRTVPAVMPLGPWAKVTLTLVNASRHSLRGTVHDGHPSDWAVEDQPRGLRIGAAESIELTYRCCAPRRGEAVFEPAWWQQASVLRLFTRTHRIGPRDAVRVFPNFAHRRASHAHDRRAFGAQAWRWH